MAKRNTERDGTTDESQCKNSGKFDTDNENPNPNLGTSQASSAILANSKTILKNQNNLKKYPLQSAIGTVEVV